tara:strand:+ start:1 stop:753 length:753 start_codon:yes stop_codon:yes gene_type:complete
MFPDPFDVGNNNQNINAPINPATGEPWEQSQQSIEQYPQFDNPDNEVTGLRSQSVDWGMGDEWGRGIEPSSNMQEPSFNYNLYQMSNDTANNNTIPGGAEKIDGPQVSNLLSALSDQQGPQGQPSYEDPTVERRGKLQGAANRVMDRLKPFGKASDFAVKGAGLLNDWFRDKRVNEARVENRDNLVADEIYGTNEDNFMKRGTWFNGTFGSEGQRTVAGAGTAKQGGEITNVNSIMLAKLIAAGADIEIL